MIPASASSLPLVAVVTPVHNGAAYLAETMKSVQAQDYPNIVHVLLENASTDATSEIIATFEGGRIPLTVGHNSTLLPMIDNWNKALTMIPETAAYFMVLCADDALRPDAVSRMVAVAESDPMVMAVTSAVTRNDVVVDFGWPKDMTVYDGPDVIHRLFRETPITDARSAMFRRPADMEKPFFDPSLYSSEDTEALLRVISRGKMGFVHEPIIMVREHENNMSNAVARPMGLQFLDHFVVIERYAPVGRGVDSRQAIYRDYRRYYIRRLLIWRWIDGNRRAYDYHMGKLADLRTRPRLLEYADAAIDLLLKRVRLRPKLYAFPG